MMHTAPTARYLPLVLVILVLALLSGCSGKPAKAVADKPADVTISLTASASLNPDADGRPSPIVVRVYTLADRNAFDNARFFELYENDAEILGDDLIDVQELELSPGDALTLEPAPLGLNARHIGVLAAYRDMDNATWRGTVDIYPNERSAITVELDRLRLTLGKTPR